MTDSEDRKLQIRLAQLNADLQVNLALFFGTIAAAISLLVFGYQLFLENYPSFSTKTVVGIAFFVSSFIMIYFTYRASARLKACRDELKNLK